MAIDASKNVWGSYRNGKIRAEAIKQINIKCAVNVGESSNRRRKALPPVTAVTVAKIKHPISTYEYGGRQSSDTIGEPEYRSNGIAFSSIFTLN